MATFVEPTNETASIPVSTILSDGKVGFDSIYLTPANSSITANYTCLVSNGLGQPLTQTIQISRFPLLLKSLESQQFPPAKTVRFECRVPSSFHLLWYKGMFKIDALLIFSYIVTIIYMKCVKYSTINH